MENMNRQKGQAFGEQYPLGRERLHLRPAPLTCQVVPPAPGRWQQALAVAGNVIMGGLFLSMLLYWPALLAAIF